MTRSRTTVRATIVSLLAVASLFLAPAVADAQATEHGWWTSSPLPGAGDDGISIARDLAGPTSVAAVRLDIGEQRERVRIELTETMVVGSPDIAVCLAPADWEAADGGSIDDAPAVECDTNATALRADDGVWTADVTGLLAAARGEVSLAIVPDSDGLLPWRADFAAPVGFVQGTGTSGEALSSNAPSQPSTVAPSAPPPTSAASRPAGTPPVFGPAPTPDIDLEEAAPATPSELSVQSPIPAVSGIFTDGSPDRATVAQALTYVCLSIGAGVAAGGAHWLVRRRASPT